MFGFYSQEDFLQEAYVWAIIALPKFDSKRGNLYTFLKRVIWNRLSSLKRDKYERLDKPCKRCPLDAYCEERGCLAYKDLGDCRFYRRWQKRNEAKKALMTRAPYIEQASDKMAPKLDVQDSVDWFSSFVSDKEGYQILREGGSLPKKRYEAIIVEIREYFDEDELDEHS